MGFRTVVVNSRCKLEFRLNYLIVRGEAEKRIYINEINTLIVQSTVVSLTAVLLCELFDDDLRKLYHHCELQKVAILLLESAKNVRY